MSGHVHRNTQYVFERVISSPVGEVYQTRLSEKIRLPQLSVALMPAIDRVLYADRGAPGGRKVTYDTVLAELPQGTMFEFEGCAHPSRWGYRISAVVILRLRRRKGNRIGRRREGVGATVRH